MFDPKPYLIKLKGKDYLPVAARVAWLADQEPFYDVQTEFLSIDEDSATARAVITIGSPVVRKAMGTKTVRKSQFSDFVEKSETGAVGRALALLGFGTLFATEFDEVDRDGMVHAVDGAPSSMPDEPSGGERIPSPAGAITGPQVARLMTIAQKLFELSGDELHDRVLVAAGKILKRPITSVTGLPRADGRAVMDALEAEAVKKGVWQAS